MKTADLIVIGSGQSGTLAADWASSGRKVVLFDRDALGGALTTAARPRKRFLLLPMPQVALVKPPVWASTLRYG